MSEIQAGEGYRLIDKATDTKRPGDEYWSCFDKWVTSSNDGRFHSEHVYRRRIPAKPEAMEIADSYGDVSAVFLSGLESVRIQQLFLGDEPNSIDLDIQNIRKLGEWCISVADWREAQEDSE
jgi:hypothetical protein